MRRVHYKVIASIIRADSRLSSGILALVPITIWYVILGISTVALVAVALAAFMRIRRLAQASQTQFRRAVAEDGQLAEAAPLTTPIADERVPR